MSGAIINSSFIAKGVREIGNQLREVDVLISGEKKRREIRDDELVKTC